MEIEQHPNLYDVLELTPQAGRSEIVDALHRLRAIYGPDSDASYSLFSAEDRSKILADLDMAEYHLLDTDRRTQYDREILGIGGTRHELPPPPVPMQQQLPVQTQAPVMMEAADPLRVRQPIGFRPPEIAPQPVAALQAQPVLNAAPMVPSMPPPAMPAPAVSAPAVAAPPVPEPAPVVAAPRPQQPVASTPVLPKRPPVTQLGSAVARPVFPAKAPPVTVAVIPPDRPRPDPAGFFQDQSDYTGKNLRRYREAVGYTLREIAAITRVSPQHLENIELDDFAHLPAPVYLKGFLKSYCKVLGLNLVTVVDGYMEHVRIFRELNNK